MLNEALLAIDEQGRLPNGLEMRPDRGRFSCLPRTHDQMRPIRFPPTACRSFENLAWDEGLRQMGGEPPPEAPRVFDPRVVTKENGLKITIHDLNINLITAVVNRSFQGNS